jgi:hypothetical protein
MEDITGQLLCRDTKSWLRRSLATDFSRNTLVSGRRANLEIKGARRVITIRNNPTKWMTAMQASGPYIQSVYQVKSNAVSRWCPQSTYRNVPCVLTSMYRSSIKKRPVFGPSRSVPLQSQFTLVYLLCWLVYCCTHDHTISGLNNFEAVILSKGVGSPIRTTHVKIEYSQTVVSKCQHA